MATWRPLSVGGAPRNVARRGPAHDGVDGQAGIALEVGQGARGAVAEYPVDPARIEAQGAQALLQVGHVVTPLHRRAPVQEAVAQPEPGLDQGVPRLLAADAVHPEPPQVLERLQRGARPGAEEAVGIDGRPGQDGGQAVLDIRDRLPGVAQGDGQAYR
jgi:hypothetical protein